MPMQSSFSSQLAWGVGGVLASGSCRCGGEGAGGEEKRWVAGDSAVAKAATPWFCGEGGCEWWVGPERQKRVQTTPTLPTIHKPLRCAWPLLAAHPASPRLSEHLRAALNQAEAVPDGGERDTRELDPAHSTPALLLPIVG